MRILIVDDSRATLEIIRRSLVKFGYRNLTIRVAESVVEALKVIGEWQPAIVLTDWQMPNISGLSLIQEIVKREIPIKVAMITTVDDEDQLQQAMDAGANFVLTKPFTDEDLHQKLLPVVQELEQNLIQNASKETVKVNGELALPKLKQLHRALERAISEELIIETVQTQKFDESKVPCLMAMFVDPDNQKVRSIALLDVYSMCVFASSEKSLSAQNIADFLHQKGPIEEVTAACEAVLGNISFAFLDNKSKRSLRLRNTNFIPKPFNKLTTLYDIDPTRRIDFSVQLPDMALGTITIVGF